MSELQFLDKAGYLAAVEKLLKLSAIATTLLLEKKEIVFSLKNGTQFVKMVINKCQFSKYIWDQILLA